MKNKRYIYSTLYRGEQITKFVGAKTKKRAAEIFDISRYEASNFVLDSDIPEE